MNLPRFLAVACVILFLPLEVPAAHVDIRPYVSGGRIITGTSELNGAIVDPISDLARVFGAEFGEHDPLQPFFTDQPGFLSEAGAFPGGMGALVGFNVPTGLRYWTGSEFGSIPSGESLQISKGSQTLNVGAAATGGFYFGTLAADEGLHTHLAFELLGSDGNPVPDDGVEPTPGIWLLELTLHTNLAGVGPSDPFWILFNSGGADFEESHEAAIAWVEGNLVPEPASGLLLAIACVAFIRRRKAN